MSDGRPIRKPLGRGRGIPVNAEGPWSRSKKLDETQDVRPPKKQGDGFELSESSFPPLPGAATISDQFDSVEDTAQSPNLNGVGKPESIQNGNPENTNDTERDTVKGKPESIQNGNSENTNDTERDTVKDRVKKPLKVIINPEEGGLNSLEKEHQNTAENLLEIHLKIQEKTPLFETKQSNQKEPEDENSNNQNTVENLHESHVKIQEKTPLFETKQSNQKEPEDENSNNQNTVENLHESHVKIQEKPPLFETEQSNQNEHEDPVESVEHPHELNLIREDENSIEPSRIMLTKDGRKILVKPSGRKFYINSDGSLGERLYMMDDIKSLFLFTQEHLRQRNIEREQKKQKLLKQLSDKLALEELENKKSLEQVDITNSNLSPFATEFVPKAANMNPEAEDFIPTSYSGNYDETNNNQSPLSSSFNVNDTPAILADLEETVNFCYSKLMETPASYDELMGVVTPHFIKYMSNKTLPNEIVRTLFGYAITDTRFAYFAVKILIHLVKVTSTGEVNVLRDTLLRHAQEEVQNIQNVRLPNPDVNCVIDVLPLLMFLSELYIQLEVGGSRLAPIGIAIVEILIKLLNTAHILLNERLRVIVNILKLTGLSLDQDNHIFLDRLFTELTSILDDHNSKLDDHTTQILHDIIILRNLRWGLLEPEDYLQNDTNMPVSPNGNQAFQPQTNNYDPSFDSNMGYASGVFYGPDGVPIDYEEQLFLEVETNNLNQLQLDQGEPSPTSVEGFDEGFDEAYEEFLKTVPGHSSKNC